MDFISLSESVDTSTPMGKMVYTVIAAVAELERSLIREGVVMGLQRAKAQGKRLGRPRGSAQDVDAIHRLEGEGLSVREIAQAMRTSKSTVARLLQAVPQNISDLASWKAHSAGLPSRFSPSRLDFAVSPTRTAKRLV